MADQLDISNALVGLIAGVIYPNGTGQPAGQGVAAQVFAGWPSPDNLATQIAAGNACVWVYARPEVKETTRFPYQWQTQSITPATITAVASGNTVTIGGAMPSPFTAHNIIVELGGQAFNYAVQATDTLTTIAAALASQIAAAFPGTASTGPVITLATGAIPAARVGTTGQAILEVGRFEQQFQIVVAANSPTNRALLASAIMPILMVSSWLTMPDGTSARLRVKSPVDYDTDQKLGIYRRDIRVTVEYAVTQVQVAATVEAVNVTTAINTLNGTTRSY